MALFASFFTLPLPAWQSFPPVPPAPKFGVELLFQPIAVVIPSFANVWPRHSSLPLLVLKIQTWDWNLHKAAGTYAGIARTLDLLLDGQVQYQ